MNNEPAIVSALENSFALLVPEAILLAGACILFLGGLFRAGRSLWAVVALAALAIAGAAWWMKLPANPRMNAEIYAASLYLDPLAWWSKGIAIASTLVLVLLSWSQVPERQAADYHACILLVAVGLGLTGAANDLVTLFLALELISIPSYILLYLPRHDPLAQEAATKYFMLSVFSSAFLLFGFSYFYGLTGTTNIPAMLDAFRKAKDASTGVHAVMLVAVVMVTAALGFKITAVPFHFYAPDVYQGAPTGVVALLAFVPKAAGFVALVRVLDFVAAGVPHQGIFLQGQTPTLFLILAGITMTTGNLLALLQGNVKRLLAYSSVAHAGYMLIGITVAYEIRDYPGPGGVASVLFYLVAYGAMTIGAFGVLSYLSTPERAIETEDDLAGLGSTHPGIALLMTVFLLSLMGMPLTAGFLGKMFLFTDAIYARYYGLALIGALNAAAGAWYYLRIMARMYLDGTVRPIAVQRCWASLLVLWICAAATIYLGVAPGPMVRAVTQAAPPVVAGRLTGHDSDTAFAQR